MIGSLWSGQSVNRIAQFHKDYQRNFLEKKMRQKEKYLKSAKEALFLILSYAFYQGRRDSLSSQFETSAKDALTAYLSRNPELFSVAAQRISIKGKDKLKEEYRDLDALLRNRGVNKEGDRLMVSSLVNFIQSSGEKNILLLLKDEIESRRVSEAYGSLDGIWSIGQKVASLILRDVVCIYGLKGALNQGDYGYLQPIDTWVHRVSRVVGLVNREKIYNSEAEDVVKSCFELSVDPIEYNQGAWFIGINALDILLGNLQGGKKGAGS